MQCSEEAIFAEAVEKNAEDRSVFLDEACAGDPRLKKNVESLLAAYAWGEFLEFPAPGLGDAIRRPSAETPNSQIGPYKLLEKLGEGGMGVVYMAQQTEPVCRKVALKIVKPGLDSRQVIARFEAERQALALMDHHHIARVFDAGATDSGQPYFVMELVQGVPITRYCDENTLTARQRLELFAPVCEAIQHAHQKGVIHRDIKPSNVLVAMSDGRPMPKVIDFGVAKATGPQLPRKTKITQIGQIVGTLEYMSPEQVEMNQLEIDTRSDVYSLGVLLYELLTGVTPFDGKRFGTLAYDEIRRIIRDEEPPKPSTKISTLGATATTVSESRQTDPRRLSAMLRRDLDWIVMKALDKDRDRRYDTPKSFAADVRRYLNHQPVEAYPPSAAYRFFKFARRHRKPLLTAAALFVMLAAGTLVSVHQAIRAKNSERIAKAEAATSKAVLAFFNRDVLAQADTTKEPNRDLKVREALDRASLRITSRFQKQPLVEAAIRHTIGTSYYTLGECSKAEQHLRKAVEIRRRNLGAEHPKTLGSMMHLAIAIYDQGRYTQAEKLHRNVLTTQRRKLGSEHPDTLGSMMNLAAVMYQQGRYMDSEKITLEVLRVQRRVFGSEHPGTLKCMMNLASLKRVHGRHSDAEKLCRKLLEIQQRVLPAEHPDTLNTMSVLANAVHSQGRYAQAEGLHQQVYDIRRRILGPEHPATLSSMNNLALAIFWRGRYGKAEKIRRRLLEIQQRTLGVEHPSTLGSKMNLAGLMFARGAFAEAEKLHQEVFDVRRKILGAEHPHTLKSKLNLLSAISAQGRHAEAEHGYRKLLKVHIRVAGPEHPNTLGTMTNLAVALHKQGRLADAEQLRREVLSRQMRVLGPDHPDTLGSRLNLANTIRAQGGYDEASQDYRSILRKMQQTLGKEHPSTLKCTMALANTLDKLGRHEEAESHYRKVLEIQRRVLGARHPDTLYSLNALAWFLAFSAPGERRNPAEAVELATELVDDQPENGRYHQTLGQAQYRAGNLHKALRSLRKSIEICGPNHHDILTLALVYWRLDRQDQAKALYERVRGRELKNKSNLRLRAEIEALIASESPPQAKDSKRRETSGR